MKEAGFSKYEVIQSATKIPQSFAIYQMKLELSNLEKMQILQFMNLKDVYMTIKNGVIVYKKC